MNLRSFMLGLLAIVLSIPTFGQDLLITGIFDGPLSGGTPKALELYVVNDIPDLSLYGIGVANNGGGSDGQEYTFPADAYTAGDFIYLTANDTEFDTYFGFSETYVNSVAGWNGDDAVELYGNGAVIDIFGDVVPDGTGTDWDFLDTWFYRIDGTTAATTWAVGDWTSPGTNAADGETTNASATSPMPVGTYSPSTSGVPGCMNAAACNYDMTATIDNGTCELPGDSCDDMDATTINDVLLGDCSCAGVSNECVRITSVNPSTGDIILENLGSTTVDVSSYRLCALFSYTSDLNGVLSSGDLMLSVGESVTLNWSLTAAGSDLGLYLGTGAFNDPASMLDFTQWGTSGNGRESVADAKGIWTAGDFVDMSTAWNPPYTFTGSLCTDTGVGFWTGADCEGTQGGSALEGTSCDDGDAMTAGDVYQPDCSCAGTPFTLTSSLIITAVYDGPLTGGAPKGVELYALDNIADLSNFGIGSANNGGGTDGQEYTFPADAITAGTYIFVSNNDNTATFFASSNANYNAGSAVSVNGDDAIELFEFGTVIDTFGDINADGTGTDWEYLDTWATRNCNIAASGAAFTASDWTFGTLNVYDAVDSTTGVNADSAEPMPVASYEETCPTVVPGCTDLAACNYNSNATTDDGTCELIGDSCDDGDNLTENDVLQGDCSCAGTAIATCDPITWTPTEVTTNSSFSADGAFVSDGSGGFTVNGYCGGGCAEAVDTWIISNGYDFSSVTSTSLIFDLAESFGSTTLDVQYTASYAGDPAAATWTSLGTFDSASSNTIDLSALAGSSEIYLGFQYADDGADGYSNFTLTNIALTGDCPVNSTVFECPVLMANIGDSCDDADATTYNDVVLANCTCAGTAYDCPVDMTNFGDACDDGDALTTDDMVQTDCSCAGTSFTLTNDLMITAIFDGPLAGGTPKGVELYVVNDIADLSIFGLGSANNGGGTDGVEFVFPADAATAGDFIYVSTSDLAEFSTFFGFASDYDAGSAMGVNGDDAVELFEQGIVIDVFGDINVDGNGTTWEYLDGWAYRNCETGPDGATFVEANWTFSGVDALDGAADNATAVTPVPVGTYDTVCSTEILGCMDENASNYDATATMDDGSCVYEGCTDPLYLEFNPYADTDNGTCATLVVTGCVYDSADNYNAAANVDDFSCVFSGGNDCPGDFDGNGAVTAFDLSQFLGVFGTSCIPN